MAIVVQKYGGSSVGDAEKIKNVARRIAKARDEGNEVVAVVSAMGDTTDELVELAYSVTDQPSEREFDVLLYLRERPERGLTREQILAAVWGEGYEGTDRTVDNFISALRRKLGEDTEHPRHLRTVWGIGYRFVP